jgi:hypothetical protein
LSPLVVVITLVLFALVVVLVSGPLRARVRPDAPPPADRADLEAAREAKYREIRDCELDYRTGKLSQEDFEIINAQLRAEALAILDRLQVLEGERPAAKPRDA